MRKLIGFVGAVVLAVGAIGVMRDANPAGPVAATAVNTPADRVTPTQVAQAKKSLAALPVAPAGSMTGYDRDEFPHWRDPDGNGCNARNDILRRDGSRVKVGSNCRISGGSWYDVYGGKTYTSTRQVDVDHMVPLAAAWRTGARTWTRDRRQAYANDPRVLLAVSASENRAKGDKDPSQWRPPRRAYWPNYAVKWVNVKRIYRLSVTAAEKRALQQMLATRTGG